MSFREELQTGVRSLLADRRIMPDVSVLLAGVLDEDSPSAWVLRLASEGTIVLSTHTEETAIRALRSNAPSLLGVFGAGLVRLATICRVERVPSADPPTVLGERGKHLSREDRQVLADALSAKVTLLYTHDSEFFREQIPGLSVIAPGSHAWDPFGDDGVRGHPTDWTFLGWFVPNWGTDFIRSTAERFFIFEIADHVACYYDASTCGFVLEWRARTPGLKCLRLPQEVHPRLHNFVAVMADKASVSLFANGETRRAQVTIGPVPTAATFHPFMSRESTHQISGACQFRRVDKALTEASVRRHWRARTVQLTDGEIEWIDAVRRFSTLRPPT